MKKLNLIYFFVIIIFFFTLVNANEYCYLNDNWNPNTLDDPSLIFSGGTGLVNDPYIITNCVQLQMINCDDARILGTNYGYNRANFVLGDDIECYFDTRQNGVLWFNGQGFSPIDFGSGYSDALIATFDGRGHTINGLYINREESHIGLFSTIERALIQNIDFNNASITGSGVNGVLAGYAKNSVIRNISVINSNSFAEGYNVGGVVGSAFRTNFIDVNVREGVIVKSFGDYVGGVLGWGNHVSLIDVNSSAEIRGDGNTSSELGGIAGYLSNSELINASVNAIGGVISGYHSIGGLIGSASGIRIIESTNNANVTPVYRGTGSYATNYISKVGGIVGDGAQIRFEDVTNKGNVNAKDYVGGLMGNSSSDIVAINSFNYGEIIGEEKIQGLYPAIYNRFTNCGSQNFGGVSLKSPSTSTNICTNVRECFSDAWYCNYSESICPYNNYTSCDDSGYIKRCFVSEGAPNSYLTNCNSGPFVCYSEINSCKEMQTNQGDCIGPYYGSQFYQNEQSNLTGLIDLVTLPSIDSNTYEKCETWCDSDEHLIYIGGVLPYCQTTNSLTGCISGDDICEDPCNYLNDADCSIPLNQCGDGVCSFYENSANCPQDCTFECVVQGGVCDLNSDCCSNNCQGGVCGSEIFECVVQGGVCDLNSDCCSNNCQGGFCGSEIIPSYNCIGSIDSNALIVEGDDLDLIENVNKVLIESVSSNTLGKCEYYCRPGFEKGSGVDENKCLLIYGYYSGCDESNLAEGWLIYPGDYNDLTILDNITPILSESDTSKKCEYYCDSSLGLVMRNGSCVPQFATEGICGDANRIYYLNEEFPGWGELCKAGSALPNSGFNLGNVEGDFVKWLCTARDVNANCRATRSEANIFDVNAILKFSVNNINGEIVGSVSCSKETKADLILVDEKGNNIEFSPKIVNCSYSPNSFEINPSIDLNEGVFYSIRASIKENSPDCSICSKTVLFTPRKVKDEKIPDNSFTLVIIILLLVINILIRKTN